jgi:hypothetical protein
MELDSSGAIQCAVEGGWGVDYVSRKVQKTQRDSRLSFVSAAAHWGKLNDE